MLGGAASAARAARLLSAGAGTARAGSRGGARLLRPSRPAALRTRPPPARARAPALAAAARREPRRAPARQLHTTAACRGGTIVRPFNLADIGEGIAEVEVLQWHVQEGDTVADFDPICEVQSDKATVEITSRYSGTIKKLYYATGDMAATGSPLCDIETEAEEGEEVAVEAPAAAETAAPAATAAAAADRPAAAAGKVLATPKVRGFAKEHGVELSLVTASGKGGRVEQQDVQDFLDSLEDDEDGETEMMGSYGPAVRRMGREHGIDLSQVRPSGTGPGGKAEVILKEDVLEYMAAQRQGPGAQGDRTVAVSGFQRAMAKKMEEALRVPHFTFCDEVNMDKLVELRAMLKPACEAKLTYMPFFIKAASLALHKTPILNSHLSPTAEELTYKADHNISIAVNSAKGLVVPNIKAVQSQSVFEIAGELERLVALAQEGTLPADDLADGTFALSNIGAIGGTYATPVVMTPQVAIGALGRLQTLPRYDDEMNVVPARLISASWSADHRIIDGATMAQFAIDWKALIERPELMLAQLR